MGLLYRSGWLAFRLVGYACRMKRTGREHIPDSGPFILASNHVSYYDPPLLGAWNRRILHFFAKKELWDNRLLGWVITRTNAFPVKRGAVDREAIRTARDVLGCGRGLVFFPEGTRGPGDRFLDPKPGLGMLEAQLDSPVPIVPTYLHGPNDLPGCFWGRERLRLAHSQPLTPDEIRPYLTGKEGYIALGQEVMQRISRLKDDVLASSESPSSPDRNP